MRCLAAPRARACLLALLLGGCRNGGREPAPPGTGLPSSSAPATSQAAATATPDAYPFRALGRCRVDHGGPFLDLGSDTNQLHRSFSLGPFNDVASESWGDQSYARFSAADVQYDLWLRDPEQGLQLRVRAKPGSAGALSASVDQTRLGTLRMRSPDFQTLSFPALESTLSAGRHQLRLRWSGRGAGDPISFGLAEWLHWAEPGQAAAQYRAPRERSLLGDVNAGGKPRRAVVLEAPGYLSCPLLVEHATTLHLGLAYWGEGEGLARVAARTDGAPRRVLLEQHVGASAAGAPWSDVEIELDGFGSQLIELELEAVKDSALGGIAFSEPRVVTSASLPAQPPARLVVLLIASGLQRELLPPFSGTRRLRQATRLANASVRFPEYRVPTTLAGGVVATLLSGLPPLAHQLENSKARLPASVQILSERVHEISGESAFFTGVPQTRGVFGFDRGWNRYEAFSPVQDLPASAPLERARAWLEQALERDAEMRRLLVIHIRGGHPPWDLSHEELAELEPREYSGLLEARRGAIVLAAQRAQPRPAQRRLSAADWTRLQALELAALAKQDDALGALLELLERSQLWDQTLFVLTGDVAPGDPPEAPFGDGGGLREDRLVVPLWLKLPGQRSAGSVVPGPVSSVDVAVTIAAALGLPAKESREGLDLARLALGEGPAVGRPVLSTLGSEYALRWGSWLLRGTSPKTPTLCDLSADPACANDALERSPLAAEALWRATFDERRRQAGLDGAARRPEFAAIDHDTAAALQVWGD
jgi:type IV secretory pathway TrbD component